MELQFIACDAGNGQSSEVVLVSLVRGTLGPYLWGIGALTCARVISIQ